MNNLRLWVGLAGLHLCVHSPAILAAETLDEIEVEAVADPAVVTVDPESVPGAPAADAGEFLRAITGVDGIRMGGHGIDPVIRGQAQSRLDIDLDGASVNGGCPNRMDPPTSYAPIETYDRIEITRGVKTLTEGPGATGGRVSFMRLTEPLAEGERMRGQVGAGYGSNGPRWNGFADVTAGGTQGYARLLGHYTDADNYEDGNGDEVRSSFTSYGGAAILGYVPSETTSVELTVERNRTDDALYAGAGMDAPETENDSVLLKTRYDTWQFELYRSEVEHVMDNYTLRDPASPMMLMRVPSTSDTTGGMLSKMLEVGSTVWTLGVDYQGVEQDATRYNDYNDTINSVLWPDAQIDTAGVFAEMDRPLGTAQMLRLGLRYDQVESEAGRADVQPPGMLMSPNELYTLYYGLTAEQRTERLWSALGGWELTLDRLPGRLFVTASSVARAADATERFIASNGAPDTMRWVGNPDIDAERHNQLEVGLALARRGWTVDTSVYYDRVNDYILRDRAHLQDGILLDDNTTIYRNVDATLYGAELDWNQSWTERWRSQVGVAYVHAQNTTDDRAIAQTPPLTGTFAVIYGPRSWELGARLRATDDQNRVDDDINTGSGLDAGPTGGYAVLDLFGRYNIGRQLRIDYGVDNLFDRYYYEHLNKPNAFETDVIRVAEPGRSVWLKATAQF